MPKTFYPTNVAQFSVWFENLVNVAKTNSAALNLSDAQTKDFETMLTDLKTKIANQAAAKEASTAATKSLNLSFTSVIKKVGKLKTSLTDDDSVGKDLIDALGLKSRENGLNSANAIMPNELTVEGFSNGINKLKWKPNGNSLRVNYIIEAKTGEATEFSFVAVTTKTRYEHKNRRPGIRTFYRVKAQKNDSESVYSNEAVIYN